ncbi:MAG: class I SAM-dependent methyltransferase [Candidatus Hodarchaeales archaeon]|jgi:cyclopropane fatty-acyl-phospholipid synthase-like methyltransferase
MNSVWDDVYKKGDFLEIDPHPEIISIAELFKKENYRRILDLGSGGGRHTIYLAEQGFDVYGLDISSTGLAFTMKLLSEKQLSAHLTLHDITSLPYDNNYFDAIISVQVIHHNTLEKIHETISEITRVLKDGGFIWITIPVTKNEPSHNQKEIEPGTFIPLDGCEKGLPHHYFKKNEISPLFPQFNIIDLHIDTKNHFSLLAKKK